MKNIIVTTGDLKQEYEILGPVFVQVSTGRTVDAGIFKLTRKYNQQLQKMTADGLITREYNEGQSEEAFYALVEELKSRAEKMGADAVVGMRENMVMDDPLVFFKLQMYGTAVKLKG